MNRAELKTVRQAYGESDAPVMPDGALTCANNLCRCTGYESQMRALAKYAEGRRGK